MTEENKISNDIFVLNLSVVVSEVNLIVNPKEWRADTCDLSHML